MSSNAAGSNAVRGDQHPALNEQNLQAFIKIEIKKPMKNEQETPLTMSNCVFDYAGSAHQSSSSANYNRTSLLDSGGPCHIATHKFLFNNLQPLKTSLNVYLPDRTACSPKF